MSGLPFDDAAKTRLAKSIISGKDEKEAVDNKTEDKLEGEWDGRLNVRHADNGMIVEHDRYIKKPGGKTSASAGGPNTPSSPDGGEYKSHTRVFSGNDHNGMMNHIMGIVKSPLRKRG